VNSITISDISSVLVRMPARKSMKKVPPSLYAFELYTFTLVIKGVVGAVVYKELI
jgi:hypothetical protein